MKPSSAKNVRYRVALTETAKADAFRIYDWVVERSPMNGPPWFESLIECLYSLETQPNRAPLAREAKRTNRAIHSLLFGKRHGRYRILYEVDEARREVWILHIRQGALRDLSASEMSEIPNNA